MEQAVLAEPFIFFIKKHAKYPFRALEYLHYESDKQ